MVDRNEIVRKVLPAYEHKFQQINKCTHTVLICTFCYCQFMNTVLQVESVFVEGCLFHKNMTFVNGVRCLV
jgi:hypothetical protein